MKITPPNYTQTPNDLFDHWLPLLKEVELKVLLALMRKTFGWHKPRDMVSISQLEKMTGSTPTNVVAAIRSLVEKGIVRKEVIGRVGCQETYYELVVTEDSNISYPSQFGSAPPSQFRSPPPPNLGVTKETPKETPKETGLSVVGPGGPPIEGSEDEEKKESPYSITIITTGGQPLTITQSDLFIRMGRAKIDCKTSIAFEAWEALANYKGTVHDWWRFIEGTIQNIQKKERGQFAGKKDKNEVKSTEENNPPIEKPQTINLVSGSKYFPPRIYKKKEDSNQ